LPFECPHSFLSQLAHCLETPSRLFSPVTSHSVCHHVQHDDVSPATGAKYNFGTNSVPPRSV
jgi:hypothetical protein